MIRPIKSFAAPFICALLLAGLPAQAADYAVDYPLSTVTFSGQHAETDFTGRFDKWTAEISFDPADLAKSHIKATFDMTSAATGNAMYDGTLPEDDWFKVKEFPEGTFTSTEIRQNADQSYTATGDLTIRGITHKADLVFSLSDPAKPPVKAKGKLTIDRLAYDLGKKSDPEAEWVSKDIVITIDLTASPK